MIVQSPRAMKVTVEPETVQTPALLGSAVNVTARPELATAVTVYGGSQQMQLETIAKQILRLP